MSTDVTHSSLRDYHSWGGLLQVLRKTVSENAHGRTQNAEIVFGFDFLEQFHKDGDECFSHILPVTGDEIWILFVNINTEEQLNQGM
jgi:hypothetical protein